MTGSNDEQVFDAYKYIAIVAEWLKRGEWPIEPPEPPEIDVMATESGEIVGWEIKHDPLVLKREICFNVKVEEIGKAENKKGVIKNHSYGILPGSHNFLSFRCDKDHRHGSHVHPGCESKRYYYLQDTLLYIEWMNLLAFIRTIQRYINAPDAYPVCCKKESEYNERISKIWRRIT